ncbi:hypothetical protein BGX21_001307 [Mortierella sp. AD011]|nr:hypothetical protein BGX20_001753 [Mortierella sp. AD010]KAF9384419.1 hypothetical protein BGX21_001307 [Mortierella sp. AD011]
MAETVSSKIEAILDSADVTIADWTMTSSKEKTRETYVHCDLAPSFGTLNKDSLKAMDEKLKVMIAGTTRAIKQLPTDQRTLENVISTLAQNSLLEPLDRGISRSDKLIKGHGSSFFKFEGPPDENIVREVHTGFRNLIADEDVLDSTKIDIGFIGKIVSWSGSTIESSETLFTKKEYHEKEAIDIGVLRYPDIDHPYFKVYMITLTAWLDCRRVLFVQIDESDVRGEYNVRRYGPRDSVIHELKDETRKKAIQEAEDLFA